MAEDKKIKTYKMYNEDDRQRYDTDFHHYTCIKTKHISTDKEGVVKILAQFKYSPSCYLLYKKMTLAEAAQTIQENESISFVGRYLMDFNTNTIGLAEGTVLKNFDAGFCMFDGSTSFANAVFDENDTSFYRANFGAGNVNFYRTDFGCGKLNFSYTNFDKGNVNFAYAVYKGEDATFDGANFGEGHVNFTKAQLGEGTLIFLYTSFSDGDITFKGAKAGSVVFESVKFISDVNLQFEKVKCLKLLSVINKEHMRIAGIEQTLSFKQSANLGRIDMDWEKSNVKKAVEAAYTPPANAAREERMQMCTLAAHDFLMLKENYGAAGQYEYEDSAYRAYMKYYTKSLRWLSKDFGKKTFNNIFGIISGYGTKVSNILLSCIIAVIAFGMIYLSTFLNYAHVARSFLKAMYFSTITFLTIGYGDLSPMNTNFTDLQTFCTGLEGFVGLLLMSMVTVVIMRKVLR